MAEYTWGEFFDMVRDEANKGDTIDGVLPNAVYRAIRSIEENWSYKWNEKMLKFFIEDNIDNPNLIELPEDFKSMVALNLSTSDFAECYRNLKEQPPEDFAFSKIKEPYGYWNQANRWIWLDGLVKGGTSGVLWYNSFTLKDSIIEGNTCPLLKYGLEALLGGTMMQLSAYCREPSWMESYGRLAQIGIKTLHIADAEVRRDTETGVYGGI